MGWRVAEGFLGRERAAEAASQEGLRWSSRTEHLGQRPEHDEPRAGALRGGGLGAGGWGHLPGPTGHPGWSLEVGRVSEGCTCPGRVVSEKEAQKPVATGFTEAEMELVEVRRSGGQGDRGTAGWAARRVRRTGCEGRRRRVLGVLGGPPASTTRGGRDGQAWERDTSDERGVGHVSGAGGGDSGDSREGQSSFE